MKRKLLALFLSLAMALSLAACGGDSNGGSGSSSGTGSGSTQPAQDAAEPDGGDQASGDGFSVGIVVKSLDNDYYTTLKNGAEDRAAELGVDLTFVAPNAETDVQSWVNMVSDLIAAKVSVLAVCPVDDAACRPVIREAGEAGIKVIAVDNDTAYEGKLSFIGTSNYDAAKLGGEYCAGQIGSGGSAVVLRGPTGSSNHDEREQGFVDALKAGGVNILEIKDANCVAETAMNAIEDFITVYDKIDLVICTNDLMAIGAQRAVAAAGLDTKVFGFDGSADVCQGTLDGIYLGTVAQDPYQMGVLAIDNALALYNGETIESRIDSGCGVVTAENAQEFLG